ncbi:MAG TPA: tetratricopeptide repeat protein, partial [Pyrinomonadaceae bacterium]|nr:tetratricopeptide repeat protein [Pyrinomonadaceae bacterium]
TFKKYGQANLIQTVPRRGYRFAEETDRSGEVVIERHAITRTLIEEVSDAVIAEPARKRSVLSRQTAVIGVIAVCVIAVLGGFGAWRLNVAGQPPIKSLAVLPFTTIDGAGGEHEGVGLADILITRLSGVDGVSVRPTSAVLNMNGADILSDARKLDVDAVVVGSIYRLPEKVRITARLIRATDGSVVWSGEFEKLAADELRVQNEIALQIVNALALNLTDAESVSITKRYTESPDAYRLYTMGRYEWSKRNYAAMIEAQRLFRNAIAKDPNFALAHAGLADALAMSSATSDEAFNAAQKALSLDPDLAEAHASIGFIKTFHQWKWDEAEASFKRSIEINRGYATAHHWYAELLAVQGRHGEAISEMQRALEINPLSHSLLADMGQKYFFAGDYARAEEYCQKALDLYPDFNFAYWYLKEIYWKQGEYEKALDAEYRAQRTNFLDDTPASEKERIERAYLNRRRILAEAGPAKMLENFVLNDDRSARDAYANAGIYSLLGQKEKALGALEIGFTNRTFGMIFVKVNPVFESLRSEPRYKEILRKMDLPD